MSDNLIIRHLQELRGEISELRNELHNSMHRVEDQLLNQSVQINSLGKQVDELMTTLYSKHSEVNDLRRLIN